MCERVAWICLVAAWLVSCKGCESASSGLQTHELATVQPVSSCDLRFASVDAPEQERWRGGDNGQTAKLSDGRVVWVFSDSWVGKRKGKGRHQATIIRNAIAIQAKARCDAPLQFYWKPGDATSADDAKKPKAFFQPQGQEGFFWPMSVAFDASSGLLFVFVAWHKKNPKPANIFDGFLPQGSVLLSIENPLEAPTRWRIRQQLIARAASPHIQYGLRLWKDPKQPGRWLFLGSEEIGSGRTSISLHRMSWDGPKATMKDLQTLQPDGSWSSALAAKRRSLFEGASQSSVHFDAQKKKYVALYARGWEGIWIRTSSELTGGWSGETLLYRYPELLRSKDVFCGTLGVHRDLRSAQDEPVMTYMCNSTDFFAMAGDLSLYVPIFLGFSMK